MRAVSARSRRTRSQEETLEASAFLDYVRGLSRNDGAFSKEGRKVRFKGQWTLIKTSTSLPHPRVRASSYRVAHCRDREKSRDNNADVPAKIARVSSRFGNP